MEVELFSVLPALNHCTQSIHRDLVTSSANGERITDATENLGKSLRDHEVRLEKLIEQVGTPPTSFSSIKSYLDSSDKSEYSIF